jgi:hypothetical protein
MFWKLARKIDAEEIVRVNLKGFVKIWSMQRGWLSRAGLAAENITAGLNSKDPAVNQSRGCSRRRRTMAAAEATSSVFSSADNEEELRPRAA